MRLRDFWSMERLWLISAIGFAGLAIDAMFHWLDTGSLIAILDDGTIAETSTGRSWASVALALTSHSMFLIGFLVMVLMPWLFFTRGADDVKGVFLRPDRSMRQMWAISALAVAGLALDFVFHLTETGNPVGLFIDGTEAAFPASALAPVAHGMFFGAFVLLMAMPVLFFEQEPPMGRTRPTEKDEAAVQREAIRL